MFGEILKTNDFEDWIRCINEEDEHRCEQFMKGLLILDVFHLESCANNQNGVTTTKVNVDVKEHWNEIKFK
jgi:hypothetical protein